MSYQNGPSAFLFLGSLPIRSIISIDPYCKFTQFGLELPNLILFLSIHILSKTKMAKKYNLTSTLNIQR